LDSSPLPPPQAASSEQTTAAATREFRTNSLKLMPNFLPYDSFIHYTSPV